ncbi:MAG: hypothetical protein NVS2B4_01470 [Ramlibacter sp.]
MALLDLPADARPREKLLARGSAALSDTELLALLLRTGIQGKDVFALATEFLQRFGGIASLLHAGADQLRQVKRLGGPAKRAELLAVLECSRAVPMAQQLRVRQVFSSPDAVKQYLQLHLTRQPHKVFAVMFLDAPSRLIELEVMFRARSLRLNRTGIPGDSLV